MSLVERQQSGEPWRFILDDYFGKWFYVSPPNLELEKQKITRVFKHKQGVAQQVPDQTPIYVTYMADDNTKDSGNLFIETMSVVNLGRLGWGWTSVADMIVYYALPDRLYIFKPSDIRAEIPDWFKRYGYTNIERDHWTTQGILVPEEVFEDAEWAKVRTLK